MHGTKNARVEAVTLIAAVGLALAGCGGPGLTGGTEGDAESGSGTDVASLGGIASTGGSSGADDGSQAESMTVATASRTDLDLMVAEQVASGATVGGLDLRMIDAPVEADEVWVTMCEVSVHGSQVMLPSTAAEPDADADAGILAVEGGEEFADLDAGVETMGDEGSVAVEATEDVWITLSDACRSMDLLTLHDGAFESLGLSTLPAGQYDEVRLKLTEAHVVVAGESHDLTVPSGAQSGLKVKAPFDLAPGAVAVVTLDFDAAASVSQTGAGKYMMRPVIKPVLGTAAVGDGDAEAEAAEDESGDDGSGRPADTGKPSTDVGQPQNSNDTPDSAGDDAASAADDAAGGGDSAGAADAAGDAGDDSAGNAGAADAQGASGSRPGGRPAQK